MDKANGVSAKCFSAFLFSVPPRRRPMDKANGVRAKHLSVFSFSLQHLSVFSISVFSFSLQHLSAFQLFSFSLQHLSVFSFSAFQLFSSALFRTLPLTLPQKQGQKIF
jgi:hypothetical protein